MKATPLFTSWKSTDFNSSELGTGGCREREGKQSLQTDTGMVKVISNLFKKSAGLLFEVIS